MALPAYVREKMQDPASPLRARFAQAGLKLVERERIPSTRRAHEATEFARDQGLIEPFHHALMRRYWEEGEDISAPQILAAAAVEAGLDPVALQRAVDSGDYRERVETSAAQARSMGVTGIPTFVLGERLAIVGAQEYVSFQRAMAQLGVPPST